MKRKDFIKYTLFGFAACLVPTAFLSNHRKLKYTVRKRSDGETTLALSEAERAYLKLNNAILRLPPRGYCIDMKFLRNVFIKRESNGLD